MVPFHFDGGFFVFWGIKGGLRLFFSTIYNLLWEMSILFHLGQMGGMCRLSEPVIPFFRFLISPI
ncbi:hypothetical protein DWX59_00885 [Enterocloster aldenensis]|nr:hypothetical protein [Clostridiales bacterium AHG0011]RGC30092.1 hypothetical protein DWX59_00885 [Enterocloster aldenensis]RGC63476.1 hypothetical protein DW690_07140 [Dorea longicatena]